MYTIKIVWKNKRVDVYKDLDLQDASAMYDIYEKHQHTKEVYIKEFNSKI